MYDACREELMTRTFHPSLSCSGKPPVSSCWSIWSLPIFVLCDFCWDHPQNDDSSPPSTSPPLEISWRQQTRFLSTWLPAPRMTRNICIIKENTLFQDYRLWSLLTHFKERHYSSRVPQYTPNTQHTYTINYTVHAGLSASTWCSTWLVSGVPSLWDSLVSRSSMQCMWLMHQSICNLNIPLPPRAFELFDFWPSNSRLSVPKSCSNAPHVTVRPIGWANAPSLGHFFLPFNWARSFQNNMF